MRDLKPQAKQTRQKPNRRKPQKQRLDWRRILQRGFRVVLFGSSLVMIVGAAILIGRVLLDWGYFQVETIQVENNLRVSNDEIIELSNIQPGSGIFDLDLKRIGRKIEENPWIAKASVRRLFPREVVIRVEERSPQAILNLDYLYYVDASGEIFKLLDAADQLDLTVISGLTPEDLQQNPEQAKQRLRDAIGIVKNLEFRHCLNLAQISEVHVDQQGGYSLVTYLGGVPIKLGYRNFAGKLDRLEKVFKGLQSRLPALAYIDLNVDDRVIVRVQKGLSVGKG
jgi:cell division protein FtsQ